MRYEAEIAKRRTRATTRRHQALANASSTRVYAKRTYADAAVRFRIG